MPKVCWHLRRDPLNSNVALFREDELPKQPGVEGRSSRPAWISLSWSSLSSSIQIKDTSAYPIIIHKQGLFPFKLLVQMQLKCKKIISSLSDQISRSVMSDSLRPHESQHARPPSPSPTPGVHSTLKIIDQEMKCQRHCANCQKYLLLSSPLSSRA